jgi:hypothetical protein
MSASRPRPRAFQTGPLRVELRPCKITLLRPPPPGGRSTQQQIFPMSRTGEAERCFPSHSPILRPWIAHRRCAHPKRSTSYVEELWSPTIERLAVKRMLKHTRLSSAIYQRQALRVFLSQAEPRFDLELVQAEHHL